MTMTKHNRYMLTGLTLLIVPSCIILICVLIDQMGIDHFHLRWDGWPPSPPAEVAFNIFFAIGTWTWLPALVAGIVTIRARNK